MENTAEKTVKALPELLAPAGSFEALEAAIEGGADAVYFGAGDFNARMRAKNFTAKELREAFKLCATYGVKSYVTVNTRLRDKELYDALKLAESLYIDGASAVIAADLGLVSLIRRYVPALELHASTQLSGHSRLDAEALKGLGFSRMVCPREMSLEEIKELVASSPLEIEMFVHGAHCVSFSGQCMMSYAMGGRSGNRGMCAQPCRLRFDMPGVKNSYPLSLSDMCLAGMITDIVDTGVSSLKIEGRQKSADYVYGVTSVYRRLLDERRNATKEETAYLAELFNRGGFTSGYLRHSYRNMLGVRSGVEADNSKKQTDFSTLKRKIPVCARLELKIGKNSVLTMSNGDKTAQATGQIVTFNSEGKAMTEQAALRNVSRLGSTPFVIGDFSLDADEGAFCTLSEINELRRKACEKLLSFERRENPVLLPSYVPKESAGSKNPVYTAEFPSAAMICDEALSFFDRIYVPLTDVSKADGKKICVSLPPLMFDKDISEYEKKLEGYSGEIMVHGLGQALLAKKLGLECAASFRLNVFNSYTAKELEGFAGCVCVSPETPLGLLSDIPSETSVIIYGKLPLMHTQRCMMSNGAENCSYGGFGGRNRPCAKKRAAKTSSGTCDGTLCRTVMTDRKGAAFPVVGLEDCSNLIYNSVAIYMADKKDALSVYPADRYHFIFSDESKKETADIVRSYMLGKAPSSSEIRRLK